VQKEYSFKRAEIKSKGHKKQSQNNKNIKIGGAMAKKKKQPDGIQKWQGTVKGGVSASDLCGATRKPCGIMAQPEKRSLEAGVVQAGT